MTEFDHADALIRWSVLRNRGFDGCDFIGIAVDQSHFSSILPYFLLLVDHLCKLMITIFSALIFGFEQSISPISCHVSAFRSLIFSSNEPIAKKRELCANSTDFMPRA